MNDAMENMNIEDLKEEIYDVIKTIKDPEKPQTLEELGVINEKDISVKLSPNCPVIQIELTPKVPHCSLATIIGLCVRMKLERHWSRRYKLDVYLKEGTHTSAHADVYLKEGTHTSAHAVSKQLNDKERIAAAVENQELRRIVGECIEDE